jgi:pimeloyl-ACP methyl ester carboxylesterase
MKITPINQGHLHRGASEFLRGVETSEPASQNYNTMPGRHRQFPSPRNLRFAFIITPRVILSFLIRWRRKLMLLVRALAFVPLLLSLSVPVPGDDPNTNAGKPSDVASGSPNSSTAAPSTIVIGFLGGFVRHDDAVHSTVQLAHSLQKDYPGTAWVETFENRRVDDAHDRILRLLGADHHGKPTADEKLTARIILYGHSWGASAAIALARTLQNDGIPVLLTVQVDSIAKSGQNDALIPANVEHAANFYQTHGFLRGQSKIHAADATRTQILGNFPVDYSAKPISCPKYPWFSRVFMRSHIEIECDPTVWHKVEDLIRGQLTPSVVAQSNAK